MQTKTDKSKIVKRSFMFPFAKVGERQVLKDGKYETVPQYRKVWIDATLDTETFDLGWHFRQTLWKQFLTPELTKAIHDALEAEFREFQEDFERRQRMDKLQQGIPPQPKAEKPLYRPGDERPSLLPE